jgi:hypothetical protein
MSLARIALPALLSVFAVSACGGDDDGEPPGDSDDDGSQADDGASEDDGGGDEGAPVDGGCEGAELGEVSPAASAADGAGSMAITGSGAVFVAFASRASGTEESAVSLTRLGADGWTEPELVPADPEQAHTSPILAAHGETLHVAWSRSRAEGGSDILYASRSGDGVWTEPLELTAAENQEGRRSTSVRGLAVDSAGRLAIAYGSQAGPDDIELVRLITVSEGAAETEPLEVVGDARGCDQASVAFDTADLLHVAASCYPDDDPPTGFVSYGVGDGVGWLSQARLTDALFSMNLAPSLAALADGHMGLVWESRRSCPQGECGHVLYGADASVGFPLKADLSAGSPTDPGDGAPSVVVDGSARVTVAFHRAAAAAPAEVLVVHSDEVADPSLPPAFSEPCRLSEPDVDALSPRAAIDPSTGDLHVLFRVGDAGRLTHARVPAW